MSFSRGRRATSAVRRMDLSHVCMADAIKTVSASTPGYVCALANSSRFNMLRRGGVCRQRTRGSQNQHSGVQNSN
jgi:hypothetical protein